MVTLNKKIELTQDQIKDVIVGALEGGSNYWYYLNNRSVEAIREKVSKEENEYLSEAITDAVFRGAVVPFYDVENPNEKLGFLSKKSIEVGLQKMFDDEREEIDMVLNGEDDAETSDVILQYCVMGELVFG